MFISTETKKKSCIEKESTIYNLFSTFNIPSKPTPILPNKL